MFKAILFNLPSALSISLFSYLSTAQAKGPIASPEATTELICHTQHASECYPAIFQPTEHFQIIHDDQSIPPGLHVRMNLATGLKEARLNIPEPEDAPKADIVIVDNTPVRLSAGEEAEAEPITPQGFEDQSKPDRDYDYMPPSFDPEESSLFASETSNLHSSSLPTLETLSTLTDLVHSYDWGLTLAQDSSFIHKLTSTFNPSIIPQASIEIRSATALLLGTAIQNNPEALAALLSHTNTTAANPSQSLIHAILSTLRSPLEQTSPTPHLHLHQRTLFLLHQLASSPAQLRIFTSLNGLSVLHDLFTSSNTNPHNPNAAFEPQRISPREDGRDKLRQRIANLMLDHILPALEGADGRKYAAEIASMSSTNEDTGRQDEGKALRQVLEPWNEAFGAAMGEYAGLMDGRDEAEVSVVYKTYESIWEATLLLRKILGIE